MWDYVFDDEIIIKGNKITIGETTRENNVYYHSSKNPLTDIIKEVGPEYFGYDYAVSYDTTTVLRKNTLKIKEDENHILWMDIIIKLGDDHTVHETINSKVLGTKYFKNNLYLPPDAQTEKIIEFIRNNADVLTGATAVNDEIRIKIRTPQKRIETILQLGKTPHLRGAGYLEGVYNIPLTYDEDNLKEIITALKKPKIKGAKKIFGPPRGTPFHAVKSIDTTPHRITYTFEDGTKIAFTRSEIIFINSGRPVAVNYKKGLNLAYLAFESGSAFVIDI